VALAGNLFGCTSALLGTLPPETVASSRLDCYFPVPSGPNGAMYKRFVASDGAYEFVLPADWLQDQAVELAQARQQQQRAMGDEFGGELERRKAARGARAGSIPDVAFGPAAQSLGEGLENVSVVRSGPLPPGFTLRGSLGSPKEAADFLLSTAIAPPGSGRTATLLEAAEEQRGAGQPGVYSLEYVLERADGRKVRNFAVVAATRASRELVTLTALAPEAEAQTGKEEALRKIAGSFRLL